MIAGGEQLERMRTARRVRLPSTLAWVAIAMWLIGAAALLLHRARAARRP